MAIDIDPATLEAVAAASASAYEQAITHVGEEIKARDPENLDALVATLADEGPYAYTILPQIGADGSVRLPILTTKEEITEAYAFIRGLSDLHEVIGLTEVRGSWYLFQDNMTRGSLKGDTVNINNRETLSLFPSGAGPGITGELVWLRVPRSQLGAPDEVDVTPADPLLARHAGARAAQPAPRCPAGQRRGRHPRRRARPGGLGGAGLRRRHRHAGRADRQGRPPGVVRRLPRPVRGALGPAPLPGGRRLVRLLASCGSPWRREAAAATLAFHTAEFSVVAKDGRFIARIGHGTEPA